MKWFVVFILGLFLFGCAQERAPDTLPEEFESPVIDEPVIEEPVEDIIVEETIIDELDTPDFVDATTKKTFDGPIKEIICDPVARKLTFTIYNPTEYIWNIDRDLGWPPQKGTAIVSLVLNSVEVNSKSPREFNGERVFGPEYPFSKNCDGDVNLDPRETTTCTVYPVPLRKKDGVDAMTNELGLNALGVYKVETFLC